MNRCSEFHQSVRTLMAVLGVALCPGLVRASPSAPDPAAPAGSAAVDGHRQSRSSLSPMAALGVGLAATVGPTVLVYALTSKDSRAEDVGLFVGVASGVIAGPAVGLWSGGCGDLAKSGLIMRSVGAAMGLGALGVATGTWENGSQAPALTATLAILGVAGGLMAGASVFHDLAITPSATAEARRSRAGLVIRSDGMLALKVRF